MEIPRNSRFLSADCGWQLPEQRLLSLEHLLACLGEVQVLFVKKELNWAVRARGKWSLKREPKLYSNDQIFVCVPVCRLLCYHLALLRPRNTAPMGGLCPGVENTLVMRAGSEARKDFLRWIMKQGRAVPGELAKRSVGRSGSDSTSCSHPDLETKLKGGERDTVFTPVQGLPQLLVSEVRL